MINRAIISKLAAKQTKKLPKYIAQNLMAWVDDIERQGMEETRKLPGYHDEPLKGRRQGERSVRLSKDYRVVYEVKTDTEGECINIKEVTKHEY